MAYARRDRERPRRSVAQRLEENTWSHRAFRRARARSSESPRQRCQPCRAYRRSASAPRPCRAPAASCRARAHCARRLRATLRQHPAAVRVDARASSRCRRDAADSPADPNDLHRADDRSCLRPQRRAPRARRAPHSPTMLAPERLRLGAGHREHEADGRAAFHAVDQHVAQPLDLAIADGLQTANLNGVRTSHLLDAPRALARDDHDVSRRLARAVAKRRWLVELHGQAVVFREAIASRCRRDLDRFPPAPRSADECSRRARRFRRPPSRQPAERPRRSGWAMESWRERCCVGHSRTVDRATVSGPRAATPDWQRRVESSNSVASGTPSPVAIFSSTTAVGLLSPRSTSEIIERLTSHFAASASRVIPWSARSARTRAAIRVLMSGGRQASPL